MIENFLRVVDYRGPNKRKVVNVLANRDPHPKSLAASVLLKIQLSELDYDRNLFLNKIDKNTIFFSPQWRGNLSQAQFNMDFLKKEKSRVGNLCCAYCSKENLVIYEFNDPVKLNSNMATADHFWPKSKYGHDINVRNLVVSCFKCNIDKADKTYPVESLIREEDRIKVKLI